MNIPSESQKAKAQLELLRASYTARLPGKIADLSERCRQLRQQWSIRAVGDLHRDMHSFVGSSSTYGFITISSTARQAEQIVRALQQQGHPDQDLLFALEQIADHLNTLAQITPDQSRSAVPPANHTEQVAAITSRFVLVFSADRSVADELNHQIGHFGYQALWSSSIEQVVSMLTHQQIQVLICSLDFHADTGYGADQIERLRSQRQLPPIIFVTNRPDLDARLRAVRAGGDSFLLFPIDLTTLVNTLDRLTGTTTQVPMRVLIVDDDHDAAEFYAETLRTNGMLIQIVENPLNVLPPLHEFQPDLILMDVYMPGCTGPELAAVIRQEEAFVSIPIVFLSGETDRDVQLGAMNRGGDDFLTKPIAAEHLVSAVRNRAERARGLRAHLIRDGLTGLLNHTTIEQQFEREIIRARRKSSTVALALIDVDHFKRVNDTYGHPIGDRVLKALARLLQQELRRSDMIGRYGGEEFVVILPDTDAHAALDVLERLRVAFSQIRHQAGSTSFAVTISAGIAMLDTLSDSQAMMAAADTALYQAKRTGRNRVILSNTPVLPQHEHGELAEDLNPLQNRSFQVIQPDGITERSAHALVVDDDDDTCQLLTYWLQLAGVHVEIANNGAAALSAIARSSLDLVFLDLLMPDMNGMEVLSRIREQEVDLAVILTTAYGSEETAIKALRHGADDYMRKPFRQRDLLATLERNITRIGLRRQNLALQRQLDDKRRQLEAELVRAARIQASLLPNSFPHIPHYELAARCIPAREVGGDFYDWLIPAPGLLNLTFGDVMGKGMPAALLMSTVRAIFRAVGRNTDPIINLSYANRALEPDLDKAASFVTLFHAQLHTESHELRYVDAGHGLCVVRRNSGMIEELPVRGAPLGVPSSEAYMQGSVHLHPGDSLILFSDGLLDPWPTLARNYAALADLLEQIESAKAIVDRLLALPSLIGPTSDDLTVVALRRLS
ncbi:MAG: response regulator [Roseiflexaceae bacterium]